MTDIYGYNRTAPEQQAPSRDVFGYEGERRQAVDAAERPGNTTRTESTIDVASNLEPAAGPDLDRWAVMLGVESRQHLEPDSFFRDRIARTAGWMKRATLHESSVGDVVLEELQKFHSAHMAEGAAVAFEVHADPNTCRIDVRVSLDKKFSTIRFMPYEGAAAVRRLMSRMFDGLQPEPVTSAIGGGPAPRLRKPEDDAK